MKAWLEQEYVAPNWLIIACLLCAMALGFFLGLAAGALGLMRP